jgi:hypothetical protein
MTILVSSVLLIAQIYFAGRLATDSSFNQFLDERILPGASLRSLRSFIVYLEVAVLYCAYRRIVSCQARLLWAAIISGLAATWTLDYSAPTLFTAWIFYAFSGTRKKILVPDNSSHIGNLFAASVSLPQKALGQLVVRLVMIIPLSIISAVFFASLMTEGNLLKYLNYVSSVSQDQQWYFNVPAYGSQFVIRIKSVEQIFGSPPSVFMGISLILFCCLWWQYFRDADDDRLALCCIGTGLLSSGILTSYSSATPGYYGAFMAWAMLVLASLSISFVFQFFFRDDSFRANCRPLLLSSILVLIPLAVAGQTYLAEKVRIQREKRKGDIQWIPALNAYGPKWMAKDLEHVRDVIPNNSTAASDYWNWLSLAVPTKNIFPVDSIIHALGRQRNNSAFLLKDRPPSYAFTTTLAFSKDWSRWNIAYNWWFFRTLRENYDLIYRGNSINLWKLRDDNLGRISSQKNSSCSITYKRNTMIINSLKPVTFGYLRFKLKRLPNNPRNFFILADQFNDGAGPGSFDGFTALNPYSLEHERPVWILGGSNSYRLLELNGKTREPLKSTQIVAASCGYLDYPELPFYEGGTLRFSQAPPWARSPSGLDRGMEFLGTGWQNPRNEGIYSSGNSTLIIRYPREFFKYYEPADLLTLHVNYAPWYTLQAKEEAVNRYKRRIIFVYINNRYVGTLPASKPIHYDASLRFSLAILHPGYNLIRFSDPLASSPYEDFVLMDGSRSRDRRPHSFFLKSLSIVK